MNPRKRLFEQVSGLVYWTTSTIRGPNKETTKFCEIEWNKGNFPLFT